MNDRPPLPPEPPNVLADYMDRFNQGPPAMAWSGDKEGLDAKMREAIKRGRPLTETDLTGSPPLPPGVLW